MIDRQLKEDHKKDRFFLLAIFILALLIRLIWAALAESVDPFLIQNPLLGDAASYHRLAVNLLAGHGYSQHPPTPSSFWPPLYPFALVGVTALFGPELVTARIIQALWGAIPPVVFAWIALKNLGSKEAWLVGLGLAAYPFLVYFGAWLISEALFMLLFALVLWGAARFHLGRGYRWLVIMGLFLGLSILAKPTALFFAPFLALWVMLTHPGILFKRRIGYALTLAVATLVVVLPWTLRNYLEFDQFILVSSNAGFTFLGANNPNAWGGHDEGFPHLIPGLSEAAMEDEFFAEAWQWIGSHPGDFLKLSVIKVRRLLSPLSVASQPQDYSIPGAFLVYFIYWGFLLIALMGMILGFKHIRAIGYLYAPVIGVLISTILYYGDTRYTIPMAPSLVIFSALAIVYGYKWLEQKLQPKLRSV